MLSLEVSFTYQLIFKKIATFKFPFTHEAKNNLGFFLNLFYIFDFEYIRF